MGRFRAKLEIKDLSDGTILVPNLGPVSVSGLTIAGAETRLRQELSQIMSTLSGSRGEYLCFRQFEPDS